jgi:AraC-like DNA-binding protein
VITDHYCRLDTACPFPALPLVERVGRGSAADARYWHRTRGRRFPHGAVQLTTAGHGAILDRRRRVVARIPVGHALVFIAGEDDLIYGCEDAAPWSFVYANLIGDAALVCLRALTAARGPVLPCPDAARLVRQLTALAGTGSGTRPLGIDAAVTLAGEVIAALARGAAPPTTDRDLAERAMAWLANRLDRRTGIADAAAALGVGREHLTRRFTAAVGMPPARWLRRERIRLGERLISAGSPVHAAAAACGFSGPGPFIAAFRGVTGSTPGALRRIPGI